MGCFNEMARFDDLTRFNDGSAVIVLLPASGAELATDLHAETAMHLGQALASLH